MFEYDRYENDAVPIHLNNCFQQAVLTAVQNGVNTIHWVDEVQHFYVVIPDEQYALGHVMGYPRLTAKEVLEIGKPYEITENDIATWYS